MPEGITGALGLESVLLPRALVAFTTKVYPVPLASPVTVHEVVVLVHDPPGMPVTV